MFIVLLGPPGAGKGTLAGSLASTLGVTPISTGNVLREAVRKRTPIGLQAKDYLERGELVLDEIMSRLLVNRLNEPDAARGAIFDGYPRTLEQAIYLDEELARRGARLAHVIALDVATETIVDRLSSRRVCPKCGSTYNLRTNPPAEQDVCDRCGEALVRRPDDEPEVIRRRLNIYQSTAGPLEEYYKQQGRLTVIPAEATLEQVLSAALAVIACPEAMPLPGAQPAMVYHTRY